MLWVLCISLQWRLALYSILGFWQMPNSFCPPLTSMTKSHERPPILFSSIYVFPFYFSHSLTDTYNYFANTSYFSLQFEHSKLQILILVDNLNSGISWFIKIINFEHHLVCIEFKFKFSMQLRLSLRRRFVGGK